MTPRITRLTPEQETLLPAIRDKWLTIGLSIGAPNKQAAEDALADAYRAGGLQPPRFVVWLDSPWAGVVGRCYAPEIVAKGLRRLRARGQVADQVGDQVDGQVDDQVGDQVGDQVRGQVYGQVGGQVRGQVYGQVRGQVDDQVYGQVDGQVYGQVDGQVRGQVGSSEIGERLTQWWQGLMWGQWNAGYYSWLDAHERIGVTGLDPIHPQQRLAQAGVGYYWVYRDFAILTPRSLTLHRDQQGRLHCEDGPAMMWPDAWAIHAWHGTRVPASLVTGDGWTVEAILREENTEVRRCAIERMGWDRFVAEAGLKMVGEPVEDPGNPGYEPSLVQRWLKGEQSMPPGVLALYDVPRKIYGTAIRVLLCTNGTIERDGMRRRFGLTVPAHVSDPIEAAAWGYNLTREQYLTCQRRA